MNSGYNPQGGMSPQGPFDQTTLNAPLTVAQSSAEVRMDFIRKTYVLFLAGILACVVGGAVCLNVPAVKGVAMMLWAIPLLALALIWGSTFAASALAYKEGLNYVALFGFTSFIGVMFAPIIAMYAPQTVTAAGFLSVLMFGSLTAYVFITKQDFSFLGGILCVGLVALIIGGLANYFFFQNSGASYWMAWASLFLFSGFVLYDTSQIIHRHDTRGYCAAALELFLDFFNIFMALLRILGDRD